MKVPLLNSGVNDSILAFVVQLGDCWARGVWRAMSVWYLVSDWKQVSLECQNEKKRMSFTAWQGRLVFQKKRLSLPFGDMTMDVHQQNGIKHANLAFFQRAVSAMVGMREGVLP
ncbi:hypothetical protein [Halomonas sp. C22]|uniref:hypothetical protein n=1 Tax=Halomonas sp. C22 TaxID=2580567 RepID=UPI0011A25D2B|nr:hypothetical protein [Halomonas sp. C22]